MKKLLLLGMVSAFMFLSALFLANGTPAEVNAAETTEDAEVHNVWDGQTTKKPTSLKTIDNVYYYEISSAEELAYIAQTGGDWLGYNYILTNDIYLNSAELTYDENGNLTADTSLLNKWTPIGTFTGIFNGAGHEISGVYVDAATSDVGLFARCSDGYISDLTVRNSYIKGISYVGGICGSIGSRNIRIGMNNCHYYGAVVGSYEVGGLSGGSGSNSGVVNCMNYGTIFGNRSVGGITGSVGTCSFENCINKGNIVGTGNCVGGIAGDCSSGIENSLNYGSVSGQDYVGGICGYTPYYASLSNCANLGNIEGNNRVGGLIGAGNCYGGYNSGIIFGNQYVGGIVGYGSECTVTNSYNIGPVQGTDIVGAIVGYSDSMWGKGTVTNCYYLKSDTVNSALNGFGNADEDMDGVVQAEEQSFFCINSDRTLNLEGHTYSSNCDATCDNCNQVRTVTHIYEYLRSDEKNHWRQCECGEIDEESIEAHSGGTATCSKKAICSECGVAYGTLNSENHQPAEEWTTENGKHYHECLNGCGTHLEEANCADLDSDGHCDICNITLQINGGGSSDVGPAEPQNNDDGLPVGLIVGISVGSVVICGVGICLICYFVKKRRTNK